MLLLLQLDVWTAASVAASSSRHVLRRPSSIYAACRAHMRSQGEASKQQSGICETWPSTGYIRSPMRVRGRCLSPRLRASPELTMRIGWWFEHDYMYAQPEHVRRQTPSRSHAWKTGRSSPYGAHGPAFSSNV